MAITWGPEVSNSHAGAVRLGWEKVSQTYNNGSTLTPASTELRYTYRVYMQSRGVLSSPSNTLYGDGEAIYNYSKPFSFDTSKESLTAWHSSHIRLIDTHTDRFPLTYGKAVKESGYWWATGIAGSSATPKTTYFTINVPARPYNPPNPPSGLTVTRNSDTSHTLKFKPGSTSTDRPVSSFEFQRWDIARNAYVAIGTASSSATSFVDKGTFSNSKFSWRVRAKNSGGVSSWVYSSMVRTTPAAPSNFKAKKVGSSIVTSWTNNALDPTGFSIVKNTSSGGWDYAGATTVSASSRSWTDSSPDPSFPAKYAILAKADSLSSSYTHSNEVQLLTNPAAPGNLSPTSTVNVEDDVVFKWAHNSIDTTDQTAYEVRYRLAGTTNTWVSKKVSSSASQYNAGKFEEGLWEWQVRTWGDFTDPSVWSSLQTFRVASAPVVGIITPGEVETQSKATVSWSFVDKAATQAEWNARLYDASGVLVSSLSGKNAATSVTFPTTIHNHATYRVDVRAKNTFGLWSSTESVTFQVQYALPAAPSLDGYWDADRGAISLTVTINGGGGVETESVTVYRSENGEPWVKIASGLTEAQAIIDPIPRLNTTVSYKAVAISSLPSEAESLPLQLLTDATLNSWAMWNFGPGFQQYVRAQFDLKPKDSPRAKKVLEQFDGRTYPLEFMEDARTHDYSVSFTLDEMSSSKADFTELAFAPAPVCYRLPNGDKVFVSVQGVDFDESKALSTMAREVSVSMSMERVDYSE